MDGVALASTIAGAEGCVCELIFDVSHHNAARNEANKSKRTEAVVFEQVRAERRGDGANQGVDGHVNAKDGA